MDKQKLIDDVIKVDKINDGGQVFERVSRIQAHSEVHKMKIELDVNTDIYPMEEGANYKLCLATSVNSDGSDGFDIIRYENQEANEGGEKHGSLVDQFQYVMHGKIFKYQLEGESEGQKKINVFISFGGLLMSIKGDFKDLKNLEIDERVYLLIAAL